MLRGFLGLEYTAEEEPRGDVSITLSESPGKALLVADSLFQTPAKEWLMASSLPESPLQVWRTREDGVEARLVSETLPVVYGVASPGGSFCEVSASRVALGLDVFGSSFFALTRYEEAVKPDRDARDRFPATSSLAYREGFLDRPVVNEYLEVLWWALKRLWPSLRRRQRSFRMRLSHDVDRPYCTESLRRTLRNVAGDVVRRKSLNGARRRLSSFARVRNGNLDADLCNTFEFIMDLSEQHGERDVFNFMTGRSAGDIDGNYSMDDPWMRELLRRVHDRGHEVGLHTSYNTFDDPSRIRDEFAALTRIAGEEGIEQPQWGGRQHYLRWRAPQTWQAWDDAGIDYDSTLTFADHVGFRCGVCYEYPVFNLMTRTALALRELPLIVMDTSALSKHYMSLSFEEAERQIVRLKERCRAYDGDFGLLWHNNVLVDSRERELYRRVLAS